MKHWIRRQEEGVSDSYAKKIVSRTIDALLDLSKNRLAVRKKRERKNGLEYTERRVLLTADAEIPGETRADHVSNETSADHGSGERSADHSSRETSAEHSSREPNRGTRDETRASTNRDSDVPETAAVTGSQ